MTKPLLPPPPTKRVRLGHAWTVQFGREEPPACLATASSRMQELREWHPARKARFKARRKIWMKDKCMYENELYQASTQQLDEQVRGLVRKGAVM